MIRVRTKRGCLQQITIRQMPARVNQECAAVRRVGCVMGCGGRNEAIGGLANPVSLGRRTLCGNYAPCSAKWTCNGLVPVTCMRWQIVSTRQLCRYSLTKANPMIPLLEL
jgi:hypothetical protein